ncbi:hypothetical protein AB0G77_18090 [Streptomyces hygroscopicus]|uniref:hypothetical protein n=1 Tax=Streptomyces hygroscopicus TaxID=1912 RepID=UPI0033CDCD68
MAERPASAGRTCICCWSGCTTTEHPRVGGEDVSAVLGMPYGLLHCGHGLEPVDAVLLGVRGHRGLDLDGGLIPALPLSLALLAEESGELGVLVVGRLLEFDQSVGVSFPARR